MEGHQNLERYQDDLGQLPMLQVYSHIIYLFPTPEDVSQHQITQDVEGAVTKVRHAVPWMGARVVCTGKSSENSGVYRATACPFPARAIDVRNLDDSDALLPFSEIRRLKAPLSILDTKELTSVTSFPERFDVESDDNPAHVIRVQLTFIRGGVVLDFAIAHNMADAGGHFGLVKMVAMAMRGEDFPTSLLAAANHDRRGVVPLLGPQDVPMLDHNHHRRLAVSASAPLAPIPSEPARYHVFRFTPASMAALKDLARPVGGPANTNVLFVSTDDAICAFVWQRLVTARSHLFPPNTRSRFSRQIDGRRLVGLPRDYMGDMIHTASAWLTFAEITQQPLSSVAVYLRHELDKANTLHHLRSFATFIAEEPNKATITYAGPFDPRIDVGCSSIRGLPGIFPEFGRLGRPEFVRRPAGVPFPSTIVLFPGTNQGDCDAVIGLTDREFETLRRDAEWEKYTEYIG
jgi:hypothetical protein